VIVLDSPVLSDTGYGERGRELAKALDDVASDVLVLNRDWGNVRRSQHVSDRVLDMIGSPEQKVGTYIYHGRPEDFRPRLEADRFVFCTAGTETDRVSANQVQAMNMADEIWVSSEHSKTAIENSKYKARGEVIEIGVPVRVLPEYPVVDDVETELSQDVENRLDGKPAVLSVGTWTDFRPGVGRKAITELISVFQATFANRQDRPALLLKTDAGSLSRKARARVREQVQALSEGVDVVLVQGSLTRAEMSSLYTSEAVEGFATLTRGEGFGRCILEASKAGLPVLCPGYTGQLDFIDEDRQLVVGGSLTEVPTQAITYADYPEGSRWRAPNMPFAHQALFTLHSNNSELQEQASELAQELCQEYSTDQLKQNLAELL
jgi:glycosyltransferase involved in cell wall biosynthesis